MKVAILFGGGEGVSEKVETLGEAPPPLNDRLPRRVKSFFPTNDTYSVFLFRDLPSPSLWICPQSKRRLEG